MAHLPAPAGLSVDQNVSRVASEIGDVLADPLEYCNNVEHAGVAGGSITLASDFRQIQIPKQVQAVIMSHHDHIMIASEVFAVITQEVIPTASRITAAMHKNHHRPFSPVTHSRRRPHVKP